MPSSVQLSQLSDAICACVSLGGMLTSCLFVQFCARGSMFDVLAKARSSPLLAQQLTWPRRVSMALDAAKVGLLTAFAVLHLQLRARVTHAYSETCPGSVH